MITPSRSPLATLVICIYITATLAQSYEDETMFRLPESLVPRFYQLSMVIDPASSNYTGKTVITFDVAENVTITDIYLHLDLEFITIKTVEICNDSKILNPSTNEVDILTINCPEGISGTNNTLTITYVTKFSTEDGFGLVKTSYVEEGEKQILIESVFKPIFARRAFPCMDEPDLTAVFSIEVTCPEDYTVISNSPVENENASNGLKTTKFVDTPKISTYLVSLFISKFQAASISEETEFKVFTRPEVADWTGEVLGGYFGKIVDAFGNYTGIPYENLSDIGSYQVAVPDYYSDSMGNFGLFAYRETDLLDEGNKTTSSAKQNILTSMAYKLSHEWYGGDVATKWWSDVWATESVATYLRYIIPNQIDRDLELDKQFTLEVAKKAMVSDGMPYAQPLSSKEADVNLDREIEDKLDVDSYLKGASILHMINFILGGEDDFKSALQYHFSQRADSDSNGTDILMDLAEAQDNERLYSTVYEKYAFSAGYPVITATIYQSNVLFDYVGLTEKRFVYPMDNLTVEDGGDWAIPISSTYETQQTWAVNIVAFWQPYNFVYMMDFNTWIIFNLQGGCFYRVNYEDTLWRRLITALNKDVTIIHVMSKAQLVDDIFNIARTGDVSYYVAFEMADYLVNETEYYPWYCAFEAFSYILGKMEDEQVEWMIREYILNLMAKVVDSSMDKAAAKEETHIDVLKRVMVLDWACKLGHSDCIANATENFRSFKREEVSADDDYNVRRITYCNGLRYSDNVTEDWDLLWNVYETSSSVHEQNDILIALGCAEDEDLLKLYLLKTISASSEIKRQDATIVFKSVLSSSVGLDTAMEFLESNFTTVQSHYKNMDILAEMVYAVAEKLLTDEQIEWLDRILANEIFNGYEDVRTKAKVLAAVNNYWRNNFQGVIKNIFVPTTTITEPSTTTIEPTTESTTTSSSTTTVEPSTFSTTEEASTMSSPSTTEDTTGTTTTGVPTTTTTPEMSTGFTFEPDTTPSKSARLNLVHLHVIFTLFLVFKMIA